MSEPADLSGQFNTPIPPEKQAAYEAWRSNLKPIQRSTFDYDLQGAFLAGEQPAANGHFKDTWKKPNHPTFSDQSMYNGAGGKIGGHWNGDIFVPPTTTDEVSAYLDHKRGIVANDSMNRLRQKYGGAAPPDPDVAAPPGKQLLTPPEGDAGKVQLVPALGAGPAMARDAAQGIRQALPSALSGTILAVQNVAQLAIDARNITMPGLKGLPPVPKIPGADFEPDSVTGKMIKGVTQFTVGMAGAGKALSGWTSVAPDSVIKQMAKGAIADMSVFDPHADNLSNLLQQFPDLANPVTEYLQAQPDDSEAEGRLKKGLEGLALGSAVQPFMTALKALRSVPRVQEQIDQVRPSLPEGSLEAVLGDPAEPLAKMSVKGFAAKMAREQSKTKPITGGDRAAAARGADELSAPVPEPETFINFSRIDTHDDVKNVMQRLADTYKRSIDTARRGVQTFEEIKLNAEQKNAWAVLQDRRAGQPLNAEESVAARNLWAASGMKLNEVAQVTADAPTPANLFAFQKMLVTHRLIQQEVIAARTETARALASWRIPATGGGARRLAEIEQMLATAGGKENVQDLATRIAGLARNGMTGEMDALVERSALAKTREAIQEAWINALLSGPKTHLVNLVSNTSVVFQSLYERAFAARIAGVLGDQGSVELGEALAQWHGMVSSLGDAYRYAGKAWRTGESGFGIGKVELGRPRAISSEMLGVPNTGWWGKTVDVLGNGVNVPVRALGAVDEFFKTIGYRGEVQALALRQATQEARAGKLAGAASVAPGSTRLYRGIGNNVGANGTTAFFTTTREKAARYGAVHYVDITKQDALHFAQGHGGSDEFVTDNADIINRLRPDSGVDPQGALKTRIAELAANPPDSIHLQAIDEAQYRTFTNASGVVASKIQAIRDVVPGAKYVLPFVRTPGNIMNYTFERTPLAPLMKHVREDLAAGGARRDVALARISGGTAIMLWASDLAQKGICTGRGPADPAERAALMRTGWQPYSCKVGDRYYAYNRFDPLGSTIGMAADITDIIANDSYGEEKEIALDRAAVAMAMSAGNNVLNKTYLKGPADFMEALTQGGPVAYAYFQGLAGTVVPTGAADVARAMDPYAHEANSIIEKIRARTPGLSEGVPYRRDLWGRRISYKSGLGDLYDTVSPIYSRRENPEPIDTEILTQEMSVADASKSTSFSGVTVNLEAYPKAYERYVELAGNELKDPAFHLGAKDFLNAVVTGKSPMSEVYRHLSDGPDGGKHNFIQATVNRYRDMARAQLLKEYPDLATAVTQQRKLKQARAIEAATHPSALQ